VPGRSVVLINRVVPPDPGASGRLVADLAERLAAGGWAVTVLACGPPAIDRRGAVTVRRVGGGDGRSAVATAGQLAALARALAALPPVDAVVTLTDPPLLPLLAPLARQAAVRVHWSLDVYPELLPLVGAPVPAPALAALAAVRDRVLVHHDAVVALGPCMAERLGRRPAFRRAGPDAPPIRIQPPWADPAIRPERAGAAALRAGLREATGTRRLAMHAGTLGRAHPIDGLDAAIRLAAERRRDDPDVPGFAVVGSGEGVERLRRRLGPGVPGVVFRPPVPAERLGALLAAADVHLAVLDPRACGLMVPSKGIGALAAGRPVVFAGPADSTAAHLAGRAGRIVDPADGAALLAAVQALAGLPAADRETMAQAARAAVAGLDADRAARDWDTLLGGLLEARAAGAVPDKTPPRSPADPAAAGSDHG
jgi:glycosyltransferase involved in cell wall biosynthesis